MYIFFESEPLYLVFGCTGVHMNDLLGVILDGRLRYSLDNFVRTARFA